MSPTMRQYAMTRMLSRRWRPRAARRWPRAPRQRSCPIRSWWAVRPRLQAAWPAARWPRRSPLARPPTDAVPLARKGVPDFAAPRGRPDPPRAQADQHRPGAGPAARLSACWFALANRQRADAHSTTPAAASSCRGYPVASAGPGSRMGPSAPVCRHPASPTPRPSPAPSPAPRLSRRLYPNRGRTSGPVSYQIRIRIQGQAQCQGRAQCPDRWPAGSNPGNPACRQASPCPGQETPPTVARKIHARPATGWSDRHHCYSRSVSRHARPIIHIHPQAESPPPGLIVELLPELSSTSALRATPTT